LAGEFAVLSQLILHGYDANMTLGHTKNVDILVSDPKSHKMYQLEVKTNYKNRNKVANSKIFGKIVNEWIMHKKHGEVKISNLFYCFVNINKSTHQFKFYIIPNKVVAKYVRDEHKFWLRANKNHKANPMRQLRIGTAEAHYKIPTPKQERYENNWKLNI